MDMARGLGAAIELDVQPERLGDRNSKSLAPTHAIQISTLFDPRIRALPYSGAPALAGWPSLLSFASDAKKHSALLEARTVEFRRISGTRVKRKSRRRLRPWFSASA